ncbi:hypothetical protein M9Y10_018170 [Tritrichomonas musculus]|uniref:Protein kinase domain-containing protein n=1 Tax=Tritrichomonas musculus TaxID=1915356 RepID=A0ABR2HNY7_9EUKA
MKVLDTAIIDQLLTKKTLIGEGATSTVYKVINCFSHKGFLVLKILKGVLFRKNDLTEAVNEDEKSVWKEEEDDETKKEEEIDFDKVKNLYSEYEILFQLSHPNIVKAYGFYLGDKTHNPALLLEYCKFNLDKVIKMKALKDFELVGVIYEICSAMKYVHAHKIIHRDLKMTNILVNLQKHVKICDFGIAKSIDMTTYTSMTHGVGTLFFMAPELLNGNQKYDEKVDVYSFGIIMYFIVTKGELPDYNQAGYESFEIPKKVNKLCQKIIKSCWSKDPKRRPSFDMILQEIVRNNFMLINGIESNITQLKEHLGI